MRPIKNIFLLLLVCFFYNSDFCVANDSVKHNIINSEIIKIKKKFAPDSRLVVFDVGIINDSSGQNVLQGKTNSVIAFNELIAQINHLKIPYLNKIVQLPDSSLTEKSYGVVCQSVINLRSHPHHSSEMLSQALLGMPVLILEQTSGWLRVQTPDNYIAWTEKSSIVRFNKNQMNQWTSDRKVLFCNDFGHSYEKPDNKSQRVSDLVWGDVLMCVSESKKFIKVAYPDQRVAFVEKQFCRDYQSWINEPNPTPAIIVSTAKKFMGIPYLWGGTSVKGVDCSGFTKMIYFVNGIIIQRDASQQALYGKQVNLENGFDEISAADLLFFASESNGDLAKAITHVGLYLGEMKFIHASGRVSINSFDSRSPLFSSYRLNTLVKYQNYLNNIGSTGILKIKDSPFYQLIK
ncbi:MAG: C40 family peptidase [Paludibacter sp.]|nr:C40 family peptidase [Paludibacter sp.]